MKILGISSEHDSGAAIIENGRVVVAVNEERLNRKKMYWNTPLLSIKECLRIAGFNLGDIDKVVFANLTTGGDIQREFRTGHLTFKKKILDRISLPGIVDTRVAIKLYLAIFKLTRSESALLATLRQNGLKSSYEFIDHHLCHAASAYYTSPFGRNDSVLIVSVDGSGDGICSAIFTVNKNGFLERKNRTPFYHSPAASFYSNVTYNLGFRPLRHEGKITGLSAYGDSNKTLHIFRKYLDVDLKKLEYRSKLGCYGRPAARKLHLLCQGYKREDIAAGLQKRIEETSAALVQEAMKRYDCDKVCLAGGLFANVRLNQVIAELPEVKDIYIHPHMGDGGLAVGAALAAWAEFNKQRNKTLYPRKISDVYLGSSFTNSEIEQILKENKTDYKYFKDIETEIARLLSQGKVVARFNGRMEYGPRALCNRSILYQPIDPSVNNWLNKRLCRTEFMPFAPVVIFEEAGKYFKDFNPQVSFASEFMTITYHATNKCKKEAPAIVHVDGTARPQTIRKQKNLSMYKILEEYKKLTGLPILINTSFNMHEEPIVCTPQDAVRAFQLGSLDILAIGNYIVYNKSVAMQY